MSGTTITVTLGNTLAQPNTTQRSGVESVTAGTDVLVEFSSDMPSTEYSLNCKFYDENGIPVDLDEPTRQVDGFLVTSSINLIVHYNAVIYV